MTAAVTPASSWHFEAPDRLEVRGYVTRVPGVRGTALQCDGFTSRVTFGNDTVPSLTNGFSLETWIAPQEYSWNWTGILDQAHEQREGISLGINHLGQVGLGLALDGSWQVLVSDAPVPLLRWTHVAVRYDPAVARVDIYLNGEAAGSHDIAGALTPSATAEVWIGMSHTQQWPALTERKVSRTPTPMVFDGLIDQIHLYDRVLSADEIRAIATAVEPANPQPLQYRRMPSGPEGPGPFGAYYTRLQYSEAWDRQWRVSDHPDIVVRFDRSPAKVVFWRGTGYMAAWVTGNDRWVSDQGPEIFDGQCWEHMSDKQCRYSHVRIIENTAARILIHWRTALPNAKYQTTNVDPETGWEPWGDDYYYIYPDGVCVRYQRAWGPDIHEFQQSEILCQPGTKPQDVVHEDAITVMDMDGNTNTFSWRTAYGERLPAAQTVDGPIQIMNLRSAQRHYVIGETGSIFKPFTFGALAGYSNFPNWNHWPVAQLPNDGRVAPAPDRPSSSCPGTLYPIRHRGAGVQESVCNLYGLTDEDPAKLAVLARSWNQAPDVVPGDGPFEYKGYAKTERAYQFTCTDPADHGALHFDIQASVSSPVANLPLVICNWGERPARLVLNDQPVTDAGVFRTGYRRRLEGVDLLVWIAVESFEPLSITISEG